GPFGDYVRIADLQSEGQITFWRVPDGLAVAADRCYCRGGSLSDAQQIMRRSGKQLPQSDIQLGDGTQRRLSSNAANLPADIGGKGCRASGNDGGSRAKAHQRSVYGVSAGARH